MKPTAPLTALLSFSLAFTSALSASTVIGPAAAFNTPVALADGGDSLTLSATVTLTALPTGDADLRIGFFDDAPNPSGYWAELDVQTSAPTPLKLLVKRDSATDTSALAGGSETLLSMNLPASEFTTTAGIDTLLLNTTYALTLTITGANANDVRLDANLSKAGTSILTKTGNDDLDGITTFANWALRDEVGVVYTSGDSLVISGNGSAANVSANAPLVEPPLDTEAPTVTINQASSQDDPSSSSTIAFTAVFSEVVTGFDVDDLILSGSANASNASIEANANGTTYGITVTGMNTDGTVIATIKTDAATDAAGNTSLASTSSDNSVTFVTPPNGTPFLTKDGMAVIEAEHYDANIPVGEFRWETSDAKAGSLGGLAMQALPNAGEDVDDDDADEDSPVLCYQVHFEEPGQYTLWVRMLGETPSDDSVHGGLNNRVTSKHVAPEELDIWEWEVFDKRLKVKDSGVHEVCLWMREDGTYVDQLVVTLDKNFQPTDGLTESDRGTPTDDSHSGGQVTGEPFIETDGLVVIEAEHFNGKRAQDNHSWTASSEQIGFLGDTALVAVPNVGERIRKSIDTKSPKVTYLVDLKNSGEYQVWVRGLGPNGSDNSIHVGLNGDPEDDLNFDEGNGWEWAEQTVKVSEAGVHEFCIWMREDGTYIDQIILTQLNDFTPTDDLTESPQSKAPNNDAPEPGAGTTPPETEAEEEEEPNDAQPEEPGAGEDPQPVPTPVPGPTPPFGLPSSNPAPVPPIVTVPPVETEEDPAQTPTPTPTPDGEQPSDGEQPAIDEQPTDGLPQPEGPQPTLDPVTAQVAFSTWQEDVFTASERAQPQISDLMADADGDGLTNLEDFAFGLDPHHSDQSPVSLARVADHLELRYPESDEAEKWQFIIEHSTDLIHWRTSQGWQRQEDTSSGSTKLIRLQRVLPTAGANATERGYYRVRVASSDETVSPTAE